MMTMELIRREVNQIQKRHGEPDPFRLCRVLDILLLMQAMGAYEGCCKGFYLVQSRIQMIVLNSDLSRPLQRVILAHELGHAVLRHKSSSVRAFHDVKLFDKASRYEYEANIFASEYLIADAEVRELLKEDLSFSDMARQLSVPEELLDFKLRTLRQLGCAEINPPLMAGGDFLKRVSCRKKHEHEMI